MRLKPVGKLVILIVIAGILIGAYRFFGGKSLMAKIAPQKPSAPSVVPAVPDLPGNEASDPVSTQMENVSLPGSEPGCTDAKEVRLLGYAWNAQMGMHFASGGPQAVKDSLMCKYKVNFKFQRQDDNSKLQESLLAFAQEYKSNPGKNPTKGTHFVTIMGDGSAAFLQQLNVNLKKLGPGYQAKVINAIGYSRGEDKFMGPQSWKDNPERSRGGVVSGVLRDGDWNIAQKWLADNGLPTNPDEKTYDPNALNWIAANDYLDACEKYITGYTETRPVVRNGKPTGQTKKISVNGVVTWTPGDVNIAEKKGGLVSIVSTKEYSSQMPCVVIGIDKWCRDNSGTVENMIRAIAEGGDAVKNNPAALDRAAAVSAAVYKEADADANFWKTYYKGTTKLDKTGQVVELGGSSVNNLADTLLTFGLVPGSANLYAATYKIFGDLVVAQYPDMVPSIAPASEVIDTRYIQAVARKMAPAASSVAVAKARPKFQKTQKVQNVVSRRSWNIPFESGRAVFSPSAQKDLQRLRQDLLVAQNTVVEVHGHTDNQGNPNANMTLSEARAFAVQQWLQKQFPVNFPAGRVRVFSHGQTNPVAPNSTPQGRARNRRVEVVVGTAS
jgi:outer membrane protein OmpA-like peptidoglycan-associated protein